MIMDAKPYRNSPFNTTLPEQCIECLDSSSEYFFSCSILIILLPWMFASAPVEVDASVSEVSGVTVVVIFVSAPVEVDASVSEVSGVTVVVIFVSAPVEVDASVSEVSGVTVAVIFVSAPVEVDASVFGLSAVTVCIAVSFFFMPNFMPNFFLYNCLLVFLIELHLFFWLAMMLAYLCCSLV